MRYRVIFVFLTSENWLVKSTERLETEEKQKFQKQQGVFKLMIRER